MPEIQRYKIRAVLKRSERFACIPSHVPRCDDIAVLIRFDPVPGRKMRGVRPELPVFQIDRPDDLFVRITIAERSHFLIRNAAAAHIDLLEILRCGKHPFDRRQIVDPDSVKDEIFRI